MLCTAFVSVRRGDAVLHPAINCDWRGFAALHPVFECGWQSKNSLSGFADLFLFLDATHREPVGTAARVRVQRGTIEVHVAREDTA